MICKFYLQTGRPDANYPVYFQILTSATLLESAAIFPRVPTTMVHIRVAV